MENQTPRKITINDLETATAQEVFDHIAHHLLTQNQKAIVGDNKTCKYRAPSGLSCAAGCLFDDNTYKEEYEGVTWFGLTDPNDEHRLPQAHDDLIGWLQRVHDNLPVTEWREQLIKIAAHVDLDPTVCI